MIMELMDSDLSKSICVCKEEEEEEEPRHKGLPFLLREAIVINAQIGRGWNTCMHKVTHSKI